VLTRPTSNAWFVGFGSGISAPDDAAVRHLLPLCQRRRHLGVPFPSAGDLPSSILCGGSALGHAGTLISAILLVLTAIVGVTRSIVLPEAMTLFAAGSAGIFSTDPRRKTVARLLVVSLSPNTICGVAAISQPPVWDVFAVSTYATISALFWFIGLVLIWPPCATAPSSAGKKLSTACSPWAGGVRARH